MRAVIALCLLSILSGCAAGIYALTDEQLQHEPTEAVAKAYGAERGLPLLDSGRFKAELERRGAFTPEEWARIEKRDLRPGDSISMAYACWGEPDDGITRTYADGRRVAVWSYRFNTLRPDAYGRLIIHDGWIVAIDK